MNNFNPNYNIFKNDDGNDDLFSSQTQMWHSYANRLNKPNSHQNLAGNDFNDSSKYYNKYLPPHHLEVSSLNNYAGPSNVTNLPLQLERNDGPSFYHPVQSFPCFNEPRFPVQSVNSLANNEQIRAPFNQPVQSLPIHRNFPVQLQPVTDNKNIRTPPSDLRHFFTNNQHERVVKSSVNGNDVRVLTYTRDEYDRIFNEKNLNCNFCKRLGKPK